MIRLQIPDPRWIPPQRILTATQWAPLLLYIDVAEALTRFPHHRITSWFRTRADNLRVGGHPDSQHLLGFAVDIAPKIPASQLRRWLTQGLVILEEGDHTHVQLYPAGQATDLVRRLAR